MPEADLKALSVHPFSALMHEEEQRLLAPPPNGPLLLTAPDLVVATQQQLGAEVAASFKQVHFTIPMVVEAMMQSESTKGQQISVMYGWAPVSEGGKDGRRLLTLPPASELAILLPLLK
jgi:hypothetical protein